MKEELSSSETSKTPFFIVTAVKTSNLAKYAITIILVASLTVQKPHETFLLQRLMSSKILGFHGGDYKDCRLLGCDAVWLLLRTDVSEERIIGDMLNQDLLAFISLLRSQ
jgi:hypothetical protein